jgi:hypothetical protein
MKQLLLILLLAISIPALSQKTNKGYASLTSQFGFYKNSGFLYGASANAGRIIVKGLGIGAGFDILKFKDFANLYAPVYIDVRYLIPEGKKYKVFAAIQPGYGLFDHKEDKRVVSSIGNLYTSGKSSGGFYYSAGIGFFGNGKSNVAPFFSLRYCSYPFNYRATGQTNEETIPGLNQTVHAVSINAGIKF